MAANAVATKKEQPTDPVSLFRRDVLAMREQFSMVMPKKLVDRFMRTAITAVQNDPGIVKSDPRSAIAALMQAAQDNLLPDGREGALVLYDGKARWQPMYQGLRKKVRESGEVLDLNVQAVFEGDEFEFELGDPDRAFIHHKQMLEGGRTRKLVAVYSIATLRHGVISRHVMGLDEILQIASKSRAKRGPWSDPIFFSEMAKKTCIRAHCKQLPTGSALETVFSRDDDLYDLSGDHRSVAPRALPPPGSARAVLDEFAGDSDSSYTTIDHDPPVPGRQPEPGQPQKPQQQQPGEQQDLPHQDLPQQDQGAPERRQPPTDEGQYRQFAELVIADMTDPQELLAWWNSPAQRRLRNSCAVMKPAFEALNDLILQRRATLEG